jgi:hypothetical protein
MFNTCNNIYMWGIQRIKGQQVNWRPWNVQCNIDNLKTTHFCGGMCSTIVSKLYYGKQSSQSFRFLSNTALSMVDKVMFTTSVCPSVYG